MHVSLKGVSFSVKE